MTVAAARFLEPGTPERVLSEAGMEAQQRRKGPVIFIKTPESRLGNSGWWLLPEQLQLRQEMCGGGSGVNVSTTRGLVMEN